MLYNSRIYVPKLEYDFGISDRLSEAELAVGGLYTVMFALEENNAFAVRYSARIKDITIRAESPKRVDIVALDEDLQPYNKAVILTNIDDGRVNFDGLPKPDVHGERLHEGYFKDYNEPGDFEAELHKVLNLSSSQPV